MKSVSGKSKIFFDALNKGDFLTAEELWTNGEDPNGTKYDYDEGYDECRLVERSINYLAEAFLAMRLDIAEFLLSHHADFAIASNKILNILSRTGLSNEYVYNSFLLIAKYAGNSLLYYRAGDSGGNFLHFLSKEMALLDQDRHQRWRSGHPQFDIKDSDRLTFLFSFSSEQISALFQNFTLDRNVINQSDLNRDTPLHRAMKTGNLPMVECLMRTGLVDVNIPDKDGKSALQMAEENIQMQKFFIGQNPIESNSARVLSGNVSVFYQPANPNLGKRVFDEKYPSLELQM